jgi:hypothetical protein
LPTSEIKILSSIALVVKSDGISIGRWVFGSVADKVLHGGATPILTVQATKA